jgi:actin, other eukaryote
MASGEEAEGAAVTGAIVLDMGTYLGKAGFAGDDAPQFTFTRSSLAPRKAPLLPGDAARVDNVTRPVRGVVEHNCPGRVSWDGFEKACHHAFYDGLKIAFETRPVLLAEPVLLERSHRETMTQIMFETFQVPALFQVNQAVLSQFASGTPTGLVVESGHGPTHVVPVVDGCSIPGAIVRLDVGGATITSQLQKLCTERDGAAFQALAAVDGFAHLKEQLAYVAASYEEEEHGGTEAGYALPDGTEVIVGPERYRCAEALFRPSLADKKGLGLHALVVEAIDKCDAGQREALLSNIVLGGGTSLLPGLGARLTQEVSAMVEPGSAVRVASGEPGAARYSAWVGGSAVASMAGFNDLCALAAEYEEEGPRVARKFFM